MMNEQFNQELKEALENAELDTVVEMLQSVYNEASIKGFNAFFSSIIVDQYTPFRSQWLAVLMERVLAFGNEVGSFNLPNNDIFRLSLFFGSWDFYECYREEFLDAHMLALDEGERMSLELDLFMLAEKLFTAGFDNYKPLLIGVHYNTGVKDSDGMIKMHEEDMRTLLDATDHYNRIIGSWKILKDLELKMEGEDE